MFSETQQTNRQFQQPTELTPDQSGPFGPNKIYAQQQQQQPQYGQQQQQPQYGQQQQPQYGQKQQDSTDQYDQYDQYDQFDGTVQKKAAIFEAPKRDEKLPWRRSKTPKIRSRSLQPMRDIEKLPWLRAAHRDRSVPKQPTFMQWQRKGSVPVRPWIEEVIKLKKTELHQKVIERLKVEKVELKESQIEHKVIPHEELEVVDLNHVQWDADALKSGQVTQLTPWQQGMLGESGLSMHQLKHEDQLTILELTKQIDELIQSDKSQGIPWEVQKQQLKTIERTQKFIDKFQIENVDLKSMRQETVQEHRRMSTQQIVHTEDSSILRADQQQSIQKHRIDEQQLVQQKQQQIVQPLSHTEDISVLKLSEHTQLDMRNIQQMDQETAQMWQRGRKQTRTDQGALSYVEDTTVLSLKESEQISQKYIDLNENALGWKRGPKPQVSQVSDSHIKTSHIQDEEITQQEQALPWMHGKKTAKGTVSDVDDTTLLQLDEQQEIVQPQTQIDEQPVMWKRGPKQRDTISHQQEEIKQMVDDEKDQEFIEQPVPWSRGKKAPKSAVTHPEDTTVLKLDETKPDEQPEIQPEETPVMWQRGPKQKDAKTQTTAHPEQVRRSSVPKPQVEPVRPWTEEQVKLKAARRQSVEVEKLKPAKDEVQLKPIKTVSPKVQKPIETDSTLEHTDEPISEKPIVRYRRFLTFDTYIVNDILFLLFNCDLFYHLNSHKKQK